MGALASSKEWVVVGLFWEWMELERRVALASWVIVTAAKADASSMEASKIEAT